MLSPEQQQELHKCRERSQINIFAASCLMLSFFVMSKNKEFSHSVTFQAQMKQRKKGIGDTLQSAPPLKHSASSQLLSTSMTKAEEDADDTMLKVSLSPLLHAVKSGYRSQCQWSPGLHNSSPLLKVSGEKNILPIFKKLWLRDFLDQKRHLCMQQSPKSCPPSPNCTSNSLSSCKLLTLWQSSPV